MAQISVIVPVYNARDYLERCVSSILTQTFSEFELILVEDGSTDGSAALCDCFADQDTRIQVIHQKNAGAAAARNAGLDRAEQGQSEWIAFVDSDDWLHPQLLQQLYDAATHFSVPISICGYVETEEVLPWEDAPIPSAELWTPADFYRQRYINATVPWGKLYRKDCFRGERYAEGKYLDDEFLTYRLLFHAGALAVISAPLYGYFINREGLTKRAWNPKLLYAWEAYEQQIAFFTERGEKDMVAFRYRNYLENALTNLHGAQNSPNASELQDHIRTIQDRIRSLIPRAWKSGAIHFWMDYDLLYTYYPLRTRLYRFWIDKVRRK